MQPCGSSSCVGHSRPGRLQRTKLEYETETLDTGLRLPLQKTQLNFFLGRRTAMGHWKTQGWIFTQISLATPQSPVRGSIKCFSHDLHFHQQQGYFLQVCTTCKPKARKPCYLQCSKMYFQFVGGIRSWYIQFDNAFLVIKPTE